MIAVTAKNWRLHSVLVPYAKLDAKDARRRYERINPWGAIVLPALPREEQRDIYRDHQTRFESAGYRDKFPCRDNHCADLLDRIIVGTSTNPILDAAFAEGDSLSAYLLLEHYADIDADAEWLQGREERKQRCARIEGPEYNPLEETLDLRYIEQGY